MKKSATLFLILLLCAAMPKLKAQAVWNNTSFVHRSNQQLLDGQNNVISLDGVNLGGWLMWEGWIWGGGFTQQKTIYNNMQSIIGTPAADAFTDSVYHSFISKADIQKISQECFNVVRIPFNHSLLEDDFNPYVYKPEGWAVLDSILSWCETYNVYAVLDLHSAPGGQSNSFTADPDFLINLWNGNINKARTKRLWKAIADRYKNRGIIAGYDLLNEPDVASDSTMLAMYHDIIDSVRSVDTNHMLFIEGNNYASDFSMFTSLPDPNMCFQFHFYTWFIFNSIGSHLTPFTNLSDSLNVPIWCGEWGENNYTQLDTTLALLNDPLYKISGSAFWTWKKTKYENAYPYYTGMDTTYEWNKTMRWVSNTNQPTPTVAEMQTGISNFLYNAQHAAFNDTLSAILKICAPAGIRNYTEEKAGVFPNPFSANINLQNEQPCELFDASGQLIYSGKKISEQDFSGLPRGLYFLRIINGNSIETLKLIKQ